MKKSVLFLNFIAMLVFVCFLTGCGDQDKFVGSWETTINMSDAFNQGAAMASEDEEMTEYFQVDEFNVVMVATFKDDGTYKIHVDENEMEKTLESVKKDLEKGMNKYLEELIASEGLDFTVDEFMESMGVDMDSLLNSLFEDEMVDSLFDEMLVEGNFKAEKGKLYLSDGLDNDIDEDEYDTYEISENELKLIETFGEDENDNVGWNFYPMTFKRIS